MFNMLAYINFIRIAKQFQDVIYSWNKVHTDFKTLIIVDVNRRELQKTISVTFYGFVICGVINYWIYMLRTFFVSSMCYEADQNASIVRIFFEQVLPGFYKVIPYHPAIGFYLMTLDIFSNMTWNLNDIFIIIISFILTRDFKIFNKKLSLNIHNKSKSFWTIHWNAYKNLCNHVRVVSKLLGASILISFSINLYFICIKLLLSLR